ncbi:MAG: sugar ABC transporter permease, partial [Sphaerochaetaceae bacterium]|nr:sugar ABC transporter permease [Sphaerochaetaceae bacterium]
SLDIVSIVIALIVTAVIIFNVINENKKKKQYGFEAEQLWEEIITNGVIIALLWYVMLKFASYKGIPNVMVLTVVVIIFYQFLTQKTVYGRNIYALGGNRKAAQLSGVNTKRVFFWVYANMGLLSGLAGIVLSARNASATPKAGDGFEMDAIAACYIGGAAVAGGSGTIIGAVVGAFIMGILNNGMSLCGMSTDIQKIVKGLVLLGAVTIDLISKQKKK